MCRWIAYRGDPIFLEDLILKPNNSLIEQSLECLEGKARTNGDGFGIGWYGLKTEPGVFREVLPAWNDPNLRALAEQINSHLFFAHVRASTGTETARLNCHPFSYGRWLFMHNGQISNYETCRRKLETLVNDDLYGHRRGSTDSELMFLLMVQNGLEDDPHGAIRKTIEQVTEATERECGEATLKMTICLSDGNQLYACRHATTGAPPTLYWQLLGSDLLIASEPMGDDLEAWIPVDPDAIVTVGNDFTIDPLFQVANPEAETDTETERRQHDRRTSRAFGDTGGFRERRSFGERRADW